MTRLLQTSKEKLSATFFEAVDKHDVLIVTSDTGSGKSTQLPTYLLQLFRLKNVNPRMVACTQPRRVAAEGVATRVAEINNVKLGAEVGFRVGFNSKTSGATRLVYMTDGLLLKEAENDRYLSRYSCVIVVESPVPAMAHSRMDAVLLKLHEMRYDDVLRFPFVDPPSVEVLFRAKEDLMDMGLIDRFTITEAGKLAAKLPVDPIWYCALSAAVKHECVSEIVSLAAISSIQGDIRVRPRALLPARASDIAWSHFAHPLSDHITQLNALHAFMRTKAEGAIDLERWCFDHFISKSAMDEVCQLRDQIKNVWTRELKQSYLTLSLAKRTEPGYSTAVRRALAEGFFTRTAVRHKGRYTNVHDAQPGLVLHTSSTRESDWIVYDSFVQYGLQYFQVVTAIEPEWIMDLPYFQDSRLPLKYNRDGFRQPQVKELLDKARNAQA